MKNFTNHTLVLSLLFIESFFIGTNLVAAGSQQTTIGSLNVTAEQWSFNLEKRTTTFSGNVIFGAQNFSVASDSLQTSLDASNQVNKLQAIGKPLTVTYRDKDNNTLKLKANRLRYTNGSNTIYLTGNVMLEGSDNNLSKTTLSANQFIVKLKDEQLDWVEAKTASGTKKVLFQHMDENSLLNVTAEATKIQYLAKESTVTFFETLLHHNNDQINAKLLTYNVKDKTFAAPVTGSRISVTKELAP
ncbi:MAG: LptA/OstA family protein [Pseudomonadota bacterium]